MSTELIDLPTELLLVLWTHLSKGSSVKLSLTCKWLSKLYLKWIINEDLDTYVKNVLEVCDKDKSFEIHTGYRVLEYLFRNGGRVPKECNLWSKNIRLLVFLTRHRERSDREVCDIFPTGNGSSSYPSMTYQKYLVAAGLAPDYEYTMGERPLYLIWATRHKMIKHLIDHGLDINYFSYLQSGPIFELLWEYLDPPNHFENTDELKERKTPFERECMAQLIVDNMDFDIQPRRYAWPYADYSGIAELFDGYLNTNGERNGV